ncbi:flagellar basal-body MS-ring/collar protein FliF [Pelagovum pacificum]|uniref:Flagellar M-ring protein n=1 Tax=Pelagovum pacificum TaxID=2588711 RepID=A0A5C5GIC7_9RHOB|nr:flagellar basal-body MS-ring/collar protein FliF [Pelagovum pacificum]QQA42968.1 flagellar M-ring protein FliF [Pelagovum pacificum]TNY33887.1 flagellar M-ring protein FliF [Pelagovum pacificum]
MEGLGSVWSRLDSRRKVIVIVATLAVFGAVLMLGRGGGSREMALLYGGLDGAAAGEVLTALDGRGAMYEVRGGAIYVEAAQRDLLRMSLAGEGLPANGAQGYELLDSLTGFGTTSQMFDAAYWRAKEGELARTIQASPDIRLARVHLSTPATRGFERDRIATAAVTVTSVDGALSQARARALRYLVASAVQNLRPEDVAVIDSEGGLVSVTDDAAAMANQTDREAEMRDRLERLLEARVGPGNAVVELSIETATETEQIFERTFDPETRVAISTEVEERNESASDTGSGDVTVASNLPDGDAAGGGDQSSSNSTESRQLTNYEVSETQREVSRAPGAVTRMTVAVLINDTVETDANGTATIVPRTPEELDALKELVSSAVGFSEGRGDVITLRSMPFEPTVPLGTEALDAAAAGTPLDIMQLVQIGVLALVALILGLFVVRPILAGGRVAKAEPAALPAIGDASAPGTASLPALPGGNQLPQAELDLDALPTFDMAMYDDDPQPSGPQEDLSGLDPVARLRRLIEERQDESLQILRNWLEDTEQEAA